MVSLASTKFYSHHNQPPLAPRTRRRTTANFTMKKSCTTSELWIGFLVLFFCAFNLLGNVSASIHEYKDEQFVRKFNAFFFHGGTEGLYASKSSSIAYPHKPLEGKSFIRYITRSLLFTRAPHKINKVVVLQMFVVRF